MAITYHSGRRIQGLDTEGFSSGTMSATGGTVTTNTSVTPNRKIHTFTSSGNFVVTGNATDVQYLVIGGGGGGTANGGGGAGAYRESGVSTGDSAISLTAGTYAITVGAGGSGNDSGSPSGNNDGSSSIFSSITSEGGGSGGQQNGGSGGACTIGGSNNGSGGGGGGEYSGGACAGGASGAYGNAGGSGNATSPAGAGGGGGGAGSAGTNASNSLAGGNGGNGLASSITGSSVTRAGGGGGGTWQTSGEGSGGSGGGGEGLNRNGGGGTTHATANTGSGGGGKWDSGSAGNGGSGIVIISYVPDQSYSANNLPNVQLGSRYEATDTRKMYNYSDVSTDGLKAYYKFDESSGNIINQATSVGSSDSLGSNADMTISGATYSQTGKIGNALSFDGSNDYGTLGSSLSQWNLFHGTGDWSINFWVNYDEFEAESRFFSNMDSTETRGINFGVGWSGNPDGQIGLSIKSDNGFMTNNGGINFPTDISGTGTWVMITVVADYSDTTNTYTVYLNGVVGSSQARAVAGSTGDSEYSLKLGSRGNYADKFFDGSFDEMTIWSRVLTADEITSLYNANIGKIVF